MKSIVLLIALTTASAVAAAPTDPSSTSPNQAIIAPSSTQPVVAPLDSKVIAPIDLQARAAACAVPPPATAGIIGEKIIGEKIIGEKVVGETGSQEIIGEKSSKEAADEEGGASKSAC